MPVVLRLIMLVGMPVLMVLGGVAAWRQSKKDGPEAPDASWRDESLDDWRREREEQIEAERLAREAERTTRPE